jgi:hypothetical protein
MDRPSLSDCPDCPFCKGRDAAEHGQPSSANPHPAPDAPRGSDAYLDSDWYLWDVGHSIGKIDWSTVTVYRPDQARRNRHTYTGE